MWEKLREKLKKQGYICTHNCCWSKNVVIVHVEWKNVKYYKVIKNRHEYVAHSEEEVEWLIS